MATKPSVKQGTLIIVCGLPGSGKTTLARELESQRSAIRFCPDEWMELLGLSVYDEMRRGQLEGLQWDICQKLLAQGMTAIIEWGTWGRSERDRLRLGAQAQGSKAELHYLPATPDVLFERIQRRGKERPPIPRAEVDRWFTTFQEPTSEEMALFEKAVTVGK